MISAQSQDFARGLVQSCEVGIPPSAKRIGGSAASNRPAPILSGDAIKGVFFRAAFSYADPKVKEFVAMTADRYGVANPDHDFSQAWDSVHVARIASEGANLTLADDSLAADRTAIRDALWTVTGYVTLGGGVVDFRADPTPECRDGSKTPVLIEYTKGGEDYEIRLIGKTTFGATLLAGMVVGIPSFRLEGAYLALVTLGLGESVRLFISATEYLGATNGFSGVPAPRIGEFRFDTYQTYYYLVMPVMLLGVFFSFQILRSRLDRAFMAVREDPVAAAASGVNVRRHKMVAFMISAAYAGFAGALYAHMIPGYLNPRNFTVIEMVTLLLMVVLGGLGHIWGFNLGIIGEPHEITARGVARTFQLLRVFAEMTVLENLMIGHHLPVDFSSFAAAVGTRGVRDLERKVRKEMLELLAFIGLADFRAMPASELSVGQRRLLAPGRAMAMRPRLLLLDAPAAGRSPVNVDNLLRIILGLKERYGLTVVIVEHILRVVMDTCGIVTVLDHGQKIAEGTPDEVKNDHAVIEAYLGREMDDEEVRAALQG